VVATVPIYASIYVLAALARCCRAARDLRELTVRALLVFSQAGLLFLAALRRGSAAIRRLAAGAC
jgi:hypothetical protein